MQNFDLQLVPLFPAGVVTPKNPLFGDTTTSRPVVKISVATDTSDLRQYTSKNKKKRGKKQSDHDESSPFNDGHDGSRGSGDVPGYDSCSIDESSKRNNTVPGKEKQSLGTAQKVRDLLCRSLLVTTKESRPTAVPFKELDDQSRHILRGKFFPKGYETPAGGPRSPPQNFDFAAIPPRKKRICIFGCRYDVLPVVAAEAGFELVGENELWNISWSDSPLTQEKICQMRRIQDTYSVFWGVSAPVQKTNHFPGMYEICRKDRLGRNLNRLRRFFTVDYNFFPETWDLPTEQADLLHYAKRRKNLTFIIKPESGCQGKGIFLTRNLKKLSKSTKCVCQEYIPKPFLIDGYKFDQRIYVLITCVDPLRIYIYDEGIARFATVKYEPPSDKNLEVIFMHLTNYSLNKLSETYVWEEDGSKRKTSAIYKWMEENGHDVSKLIGAIDDVIVKTLLCAAPTLRHNYKTCFPKRDRGSCCFELLGFDILIDGELNPVLLEVNHSPSFNLDLPVDSEVKKELLRDMFNMVYLGDELSPSKRNRQARSSNAGKARVNEDDQQQHRIRKSAVRSPPSPPPPPSPVKVEPRSLLPKFLLNQFRHEIRNKGKFRLIYSSEKPGKYGKLLEETYCGFACSSANTGLLLEQVLDHQQGNNRKPSRNTNFKSGQVDRQVQNTFKMTKNRQSDMGNKNIPSTSTCSSLSTQRGRQIATPPRPDLSLTRRTGYSNQLKKLQDLSFLQKGTRNGVQVVNSSNINCPNEHNANYDDVIGPIKSTCKKGNNAAVGGKSNIKFQSNTDNKNNNKK